MEETISTEFNIAELNEKIEKESAFIDLIKIEMSKVIVGQPQMTDALLIGLLSDGHILLEGLPGLAKTLAINTLGKIINADFSRVQFTPDLLPADVIGTLIYNQKKEEFIVKKGPVFANFILADEINRSPAKVQSALLEAMQEKQVTIGGETYPLPQPFLVLATQNPIEQEGTYPLPEAQLDRFMYSVFLDYPSLEEEVDIVKRTTLAKIKDVKQIFSASDLLSYQNLILNTPVNDNVIKYAVELVHKTRPNQKLSSDYVNKYINFDAGPRASQYLIMGAKINAILSGKYSPDIEDVQFVASWVLSHRLVRNYKAEAENITTQIIISNLL